MFELLRRRGACHRIISGQNSLRSEPLLPAERGRVVVLLARLDHPGLGCIGHSQVSQSGPGDEATLVVGAGSLGVDEVHGGGDGSVSGSSMRLNDLARWSAGRTDESPDSWMVETSTSKVIWEVNGVTIALSTDATSGGVAAKLL